MSAVGVAFWLGLFAYLAWREYLAYKDRNHE
jgi:hypothetical protein